jgi:hypothetical protein
MRELAQAKRHYSKLPLFEFLRSESIPPRDRLAFYPCMAPFILAFSDLNRFVLRDENSKNPHQRLINEHTNELLAYATNSLAQRTVPHIAGSGRAR